MAGGKKRQLPACAEGPDDDADGLAIIAQPCCPPRRQHAGSCEPASAANTAGAISEKLKRATSSIAKPLRIPSIVLQAEGGSIARSKQWILEGVCATPLHVVGNAESVHGALHVADGEDFASHRVPRLVVGFAIERGRVVGADGTFEAALMVDAQHLRQIHGTVIVEGFAEVFAGALDVAEVHEEDLLLGTPFAGQGRDVLAHEFEIRLAEGNAVHGAGDDVENAPVVGGAGDNAADAAQGRERGIVGMQGHLDAGLFGYGNDSLEEIVEVAPDFLFADPPPFGEALPLGIGAVEFGEQRAAASADVRARAEPADAGHPVVADQVDAHLGERANGGDVVFDLLVAAGKAELDLFRGHGIALGAGKHEARRRELLANAREHLDIAIARRMAEGLGDGHDAVGDPDLSGEADFVVLVGTEELSQLQATVGAWLAERGGGRRLRRCRNRGRTECRHGSLNVPSPAHFGHSITLSSESR
ncbi:hypothetical protein SBA6_1280012 [Candidatus Sulfopaludibacter sp. SbA6]|nr:hypothetical protein SBA6_1280012 [Candidatus Sulfopaludibacter sp. SbA6]